MSNDEIHHIFVEVATGRGRHGGFVMSFAQAVMHADPSNFELVRPTAMDLIAKYELHRYLDNFVVCHKPVDGVL
jgi:hypothetical protein